LGYTGHSGCSFALTIRTLQSIAKDGEDQYRKFYLQNK